MCGERANRKETMSNCSAEFQEPIVLPKRAVNPDSAHAHKERTTVKGQNIRGIIEKSCSIMFEG